MSQNQKFSTVRSSRKFYIGCNSNQAKKLWFHAFGKRYMLKNAKKPSLDTNFQIHFAAFVCKIGKKAENLWLDIELLFLKRIRSFLYVSCGRLQPCKTFPDFRQFLTVFRIFFSEYMSQNYKLGTARSRKKTTLKCNLNQAHWTNGTRITRQKLKILAFFDNFF